MSFSTCSTQLARQEELAKMVTYRGSVDDVMRWLTVCAHNRHRHYDKFPKFLDSLMFTFCLTRVKTPVFSQRYSFFLVGGSKLRTGVSYKNLSTTKRMVPQGVSSSWPPQHSRFCHVLSNFNRSLASENSDGCVVLQVPRAEILLGLLVARSDQSIQCVSWLSGHSTSR